MSVRVPDRFELPGGAVVGKYEIIRKIATGGMAEIYLARARGTAGFEKLVVLKRILPHVAQDPTFVQMFLDEARLAATLQHPNIADVYDVGEVDGTYFFTMEFVHGQDVRSIRIAERNRAQRVPLAIALALVHGTAAALDYAHERTGPDGRPLGLVHRDISSSNVLVSYDGAVKLVDFGIARASSSDRKTRTGTLKGKIPYMSPEQAKGQPVDRRSDLFSLGVVLYELTVGRRPFRGGSDFVILEQIVHHGAPPPSSVVSGYPADLEAIILKMLARDPNDRYASGEEVLHALEQFVAQHQLWVSAKAVGKYMRTLFAEHIAAWQAAEQEGVSFVEHLADTIQPRGAPPKTPSSLTAVSADDDDADVDPSSLLPYGDPPSSTGAVVRSPTAITMLAMSSAPPSQVPDVSLRPSRAPWYAVAGLLLCGAGAAGGYAVYHGGRATDSPGASAPQASSGTVAAPIVAVPIVAVPIVAAPTPASAPVAAPAQPAAAPSPVAIAPTPAATPAAPAPATPEHPAPQPHAKPHPIAHPAPKPDHPPSQWDPNSPYLPGQTP